MTLELRIIGETTYIIKLDKFRCKEWNERNLLSMRVKLTYMLSRKI